MLATKLKHLMGLIVIGLVLSTTPNATASWEFTFLRVNPANAPVDVASQFKLLLDATPTGNGISFTFLNNGPILSSITDIYFDYPNDLNKKKIDNIKQAMVPGTIANGSGVSFKWDASPPNLPGGNNLEPDFKATVSAQSGSPVQPNGVNPGEWVKLSFSLYPNTLKAADIAEMLYSQELRVGIHVQGIKLNDKDYSDSFYAVPEPTTFITAGLLVLPFTAGLGRILRAKQRNT